MRHYHTLKVLAPGVVRSMEVVGAPTDFRSDVRISRATPLLQGRGFYQHGQFVGQELADRGYRKRRTFLPTGYRGRQMVGALIEETGDPHTDLMLFSKAMLARADAAYRLPRNVDTTSPREVYLCHHGLL